MNVIPLELLLSMPMDLPWLIQGHLSRVEKPMFFQANVRRSFIHRFQVKWFGCTLLDMIQEKGL
jgi:hypothetical protein